MIYIVVSNIDLDQMIAEVNDLISEGWKPIGGISNSPESQEYNPFFCQAMIKQD